MTEPTRHLDGDPRELLVPFLLGQLSGEQSRELEQLIATDAGLRAELIELEATGARLLSGLPRHEAPPELRARVLDAVSAAADRSTRPLAVVRDAEAPAPALPTLRRRPRFVVPAFGLGLAAACVALAVFAINLDNDLAETRAQLQSTAEQLDDRASAAPAIAGSRPIPVSTHGAFRTSEGELLRVGSDRYVLLLRKVPSPGVGKSWQVWTADSNGQVRNVQSWATGDDYQAVVLTARDVAQVMISHEQTTRRVAVPSDSVVASVKV